MFVTVNIKEFGGNELVKYITVKEIVTCWRSSPLNKSDQVISCGIGRRPSTGRAPDPGLKLQAPGVKLSSIRRQASSPRQQASSVKPQAASSLILDPRNMDIEEVLGVQGPRVFAKIKVLCG